jgi:hypothetical protein
MSCNVTNLGTTTGKYDTRDNMGSDINCSSEDEAAADTTAALPLIPTLSQCPDGPASGRLPQIILRPRTRWNRRHDWNSGTAPDLPRQLPLPPPPERSFVKRKHMPVQDSTLPLTSPNNSDQDMELRVRASHEQGLMEAPTSIQSDEACAAEDNLTLALRSQKKARENSPCLVQFQESTIMKKDKTTSLVTPTPLGACLTTHPSLEESITKPRPVPRYLFPTSTKSEGTMGVKKVSLLSRHINSTGSAFQGS